MNVRPKFPKDRRLGGMEVVVLERENQALTAEVERLRDLLEKCPGEATGKDATVFEVRKMKSQIAQLSRQHCLMNNEIKNSRELAAECEVILSDFSSRVAKAIGNDNELRQHERLDALLEVRTWSLQMLSRLKRRMSADKPCSQDGLDCDYIATGGNNCLKVIEKRPTASEVFDGRCLLRPKVQMWIHHVHEEVSCLSPQMSRHTLMLETVLLPTLHWADDDFKQQLAAETSSIAAGLSKLLGLISDIAFLTPSQVCSPIDKPATLASTKSGDCRDLSGKSQIQRISNHLKQCKSNQARAHNTEVARLVQLLEEEISKREQIEQSIDHIKLGCSNISHLLHDLQDLATDLRQQSDKPPPDLDSLQELIHIGNKLALLPTEALVRNLVTTLLANLEDLGDIPNRIHTHLRSAHQVTAPRKQLKQPPHSKRLIKRFGYFLRAPNWPEPRRRWKRALTGLSSEGPNDN